MGARLRQPLLLLVTLAVVHAAPQGHQLWPGPRRDGAPAVLLRRSSVSPSERQEWRPLGPVGPAPSGPTLQYAPPVVNGGPLRPARRRVDGPLPQGQPAPPRRRRPRPPQAQQSPLSRPPPRRRPAGQPGAPAQWGARLPQRPQRRPQRPPQQQDDYSQLPQPPQRRPPPPQSAGAQLSQPPQRRPQRPPPGGADFEPQGVSTGVFRPPQLPPSGPSGEFERFSISESDSDGWTPAGFGTLQTIPAPSSLARPAPPSVARPAPEDVAPVAPLPEGVPPPVPPVQSGSPAFQPQVDLLPSDAFTPMLGTVGDKPASSVGGQTAEEYSPETTADNAEPFRRDRPIPSTDTTVSLPEVAERVDSERVKQRVEPTTQSVEFTTARTEGKSTAENRGETKPGRRPAFNREPDETVEKGFYDSEDATLEEDQLRVTESAPVVTSSTTVRSPATTERATTAAPPTTTERVVATSQRVPETTSHSSGGVGRPAATPSRTSVRRPTSSAVKTSAKGGETSGIRKRRPLSSFLKRRPDLNRLRPRTRPGATVRPTTSEPAPVTKPSSSAGPQTLDTSTPPPQPTNPPTTAAPRPTPPARPSTPQSEPASSQRPDTSEAPSTTSSRPQPKPADGQALIDRLIKSELESSHRRRRPGAQPSRRPLPPPGGRPARPQRPSIFDRLAAGRPTRRPRPSLLDRSQTEKSTPTSTERPTTEKSPRRPVQPLPVRPSTSALPQRPVSALREDPPQDEQATEVASPPPTETPRATRRPRPPPFVRPSAERPSPFVRPSVERPSPFVRPSVERPSPFVRPSAARPPPLIRPSAAASLSGSPPSSTTQAPDSEPPTTVSAERLARPSPASHQLPGVTLTGGLNFGIIRPVSVAQNLVASSPYTHTGGYSRIKMYGINAKKQSTKSKKAAYQARRTAETNAIGFSSEVNEARKSPRVDVQAEQNATSFLAHGTTPVTPTTPSETKQVSDSQHGQREIQDAKRQAAGQTSEAAPVEHLSPVKTEPTSFQQHGTGSDTTTREEPDLMQKEPIEATEDDGATTERQEEPDDQLNRGLTTEEQEQEPTTEGQEQMSVRQEETAKDREQTTEGHIHTDGEHGQTTEGQERGATTENTSGSPVETTAHQHLVSGEPEVTTEQDIKGDFTFATAEPELFGQEQQPAPAADGASSQAEAWIPVIPVHTSQVETSEHGDAAVESHQAQDHPSLETGHTAEHHPADEPGTAEAERAREAQHGGQATEASGYQQLEYYIEDPADLEAHSSVWSPVASGVVRVPVRPTPADPDDPASASQSSTPVGVGGLHGPASHLPPPPPPGAAPQPPARTEPVQSGLPGRPGQPASSSSTEVAPNEWTADEPEQTVLIPTDQQFDGIDQLVEEVEGEDPSQFVSTLEAEEADQQELKLAGFVGDRVQGAAYLPDPSLYQPSETSAEPDQVAYEVDATQPDGPPREATRPGQIHHGHGEVPVEPQPVAMGDSRPPAGHSPPPPPAGHPPPPPPAGHSPPPPPAGHPPPPPPAGHPPPPPPAGRLPPPLSAGHPPPPRPAGRPPPPGQTQYLPQSAETDDQPLSEVASVARPGDGRRPQPADRSPPPAPGRPRPRPQKPSGGWMSGLLSGLFGGRPAGPTRPGTAGDGGSPGGTGGSGGLLAGLFRRPSAPAPAPARGQPAPAAGRDELPPVQNDPILAAMFGPPSAQVDGDVSPAAAGAPGGSQAETGGQTEERRPPN